MTYTHKKIVSIDFEFNAVSEPRLNLVSVVFEIYCRETKQISVQSVWLHRNESGKAWARKLLESLMTPDTLFVSYVAEAEIRSLLTLFDGDDAARQKILGLKVVDLYLEYRNLLNRDNSLSYGKQYIDGKIIETTPPPNKWELVEGDEDGDDEKHHKPEFSLAAATYKLLGEMIDTDEKDRVRGLIIHSDPDEIDAARDQILAYNESDIKNLRRLMRAVEALYVKAGHESHWFEDALTRGSYACETAAMLERGYPVDVPGIKKFTADAAKILGDAAAEVNRTGVWAFRANGSMDTKAVKTWVENHLKENNVTVWRKTKGGGVSLSKDAFGDYFNSESDGFPGAFCRYLKTKQSLNGFLPPRDGAKRKKTFWDFVGSDGRVRPFFSIYGSQTSRSQPSATSFMWLKAKWMRSFVRPRPGRAMIEIDYSSQEFLIAALLSQDMDMMAAYESGDVYLAFGKAAGLIPATGTKETHNKERDLCKGIVLGVSYDMSARGLAPRISKYIEGGCDEAKAQGLINAFYDAYPDYAAWKRQTIKEYEDSGYLRLSDGWTMWGDNDNKRSVGNFPVQGHGAVVMRKAVKDLTKAEIETVFTVHDAIVAECDSANVAETAELMAASMVESFDKVFQPYGVTRPIRVEGVVWSDDFEDNQEIAGLPEIFEVQRIYVDAAAKTDIKKFCEYLTGHSNHK